jgi:hypothetical protein
MFGELLTRWTVRLALACYVACLAGWLAAPVGMPGRSLRLAGPWLWTAGCLLFLLHVASAFHFYHHWSHAAAWESTAAETDALLGIRFGEGIYFSYAFALFWAADVLWMWAGRVWIADMPGSGVRMAVQGYLLFIAFNGAIVFEAGPTRWAGLAACLVLGGLAVWAAYNWARNEQRTAH